MTWLTGNYNRMLRHVNNANQLSIEVGIVQNQTHTTRGKSISTATLYRFHEEGTRTIPKRATLRPAMQKYKHQKAAKIIAQSLVTGRYQQAYQSVGAELAKAVKTEIMQIKSPPLKPATIANRVNGGSNPLVDTGQLLRQIGHVVKQ